MITRTVVERVGFTTWTWLEFWGFPRGFPFANMVERLPCCISYFSIEFGVFLEQTKSLADLKSISLNFSCPTVRV